MRRRRCSGEGRRVSPEAEGYPQDRLDVYIEPIAFTTWVESASLSHADPRPKLGKRAA